MFLTLVMGDITSIFQTLQKYCQLENIILPDVVKHRDNAIKKLRLMLSGPYPGRYEEKWGQNNTGETTNSEDDDGDAARLPTSRHMHNTLVTTYRRDQGAFRNEIVQSAINFLEQRLDYVSD